MVNRSFILILLITLLSANLFSQEQDTVYKKKNFWQRMDSIKNWKLDKGRATFTPFIAPSYTPETSVMLTAGGLFTFKIKPDNKLLSRSSVPFSIGYSTNGSLLVSIKANIYGLSDKLRFTGEYWNKNMPDNYWGVGYEKGRYTPKSETTTAYHRNWQQFKFKIAYQLIPKFYAGINYDYNSTVATYINPVMAVDSDYLKHGSDVFNSGIGLVLRYDSRDFPENAFKGILFEFSGTGYGKHTRSNNIFEVGEVDYKQYQTILRKGNTLAWEVKTRYSTGDIPWTDLSMVGTPFDLRGYIWGNYRDRTMAFVLTEYRYMLPRKTANARGELFGPFGFVVWAGTGSVGKDYGNLIHWLPNGGLGLRFEIQERMNVRIDYGRGVDSSAFYINFTEAF